MKFGHVWYGEHLYKPIKIGIVSCETYVMEEIIIWITFYINVQGWVQNSPHLTED